MCNSSKIKKYCRNYDHPILCACSYETSDLTTPKNQTNKMKPKHCILTALTAGLAALSTTQAATIAWVGVNTNIDSTADDGATSGWNSSGNTKSLDIDGDNILGTHGWHYAFASGGGGLAGRKALPASLTTTNATTPNANLANSQVRDAPAAGILTGNPATEAAIGSWWRNNTASATQNAISFTVASAAPYAGQILRLGVLFDSSTTNPFTGSQTYTLTQTVGGTATATSTTLNFAADGLDAAFFDLTNLSNGDTFQLSFTNATGSLGHLSGLTFDTAIPEPSTALLGGLGLLALLRRRR